MKNITITISDEKKILIKRVTLIASKLAFMFVFWSFLLAVPLRPLLWFTYFLGIVSAFIFVYIKKNTKDGSPMFPTIFLLILAFIGYAFNVFFFVYAGGNLAFTLMYLLLMIFVALVVYVPFRVGYKSLSTSDKWWRAVALYGMCLGYATYVLMHLGLS